MQIDPGLGAQAANQFCQFAGRRRRHIARQTDRDRALEPGEDGQGLSAFHMKFEIQEILGNLVIGAVRG